MKRFYLQTLGTPALTLEESSLNPNSEIRFRYRDTWALLASLVLEPHTNRREALIVRLALNQRVADTEQTGRDTLRFRLNDLRHGAPSRGKKTQDFCGVGVESVLADTETVALAHDLVQSDLQKIQVALRQAGQLATPQQKVSCLREAAVLLRGEFLEGYELAGEGDGWLERMRFETWQLSAEIWLQLAQTLDAMGERRSAFDAVRKAYSFRPEHPETLELLLDLADGVPEEQEVLHLSKHLGVEELLPRLKFLEDNGLPLTITEEQALAHAVKTRLTQLSQKVVAGVLAISGFPQGFTAEQAQAICGVSGETLERMTHAFPLTKESSNEKRPECYSLVSALRVALQNQLPDGELALFRERHATYFERFLAIEITKTASFCALLVIEMNIEEHLFHSMKYFIENKPVKAGVEFINNIWMVFGQVPKMRDKIFCSKNYLEQAVEELSPEDAGVATEMLAAFAMAREDFTQAVYWLRLKLERINSKDQRTTCLKILEAAHHANDDAYFDTIATLLLVKWPVTYPPELRGEFYFWEQVHIQMTENCMSRRRFTEAIKHNETAFTLRCELGYPKESLPVLWSQKGAILNRLGRYTEAELCWDRALLGYLAQDNRGGAAECYEAMGLLAARSGRVGLGIALIEQAISIFEEIDNQGAVAAAQGTLGEIFRERGDRQRARELFEKGMAFWRERQHPRWIFIFQQRLDDLELSSGRL